MLYVTYCNWMFGACCFVLPMKVLQAEDVFRVERLSQPCSELSAPNKLNPCLSSPFHNVYVSDQGYQCCCFIRSSCSHNRWWDIGFQDQDYYNNSVSVLWAGHMAHYSGSIIHAWGWHASLFHEVSLQYKPDPIAGFIWLEKINRHLNGDNSLRGCQRGTSYRNLHPVMLNRYSFLKDSW